MCGVSRSSNFNLTRSKLNLIIVVSILLCLIPVQPAVSTETPEFPMGLTLEYDVVQELGFNIIPLSTCKYEVLGLLGSNVILMSITNSWGDHTVHVHLPQWYAEYENGSEYGDLKPLWIDISSWQTNDNVTLGSMGLFELTGSRTVESDLGDYRCWTARKESSTIQSDQYEHYYYNHAHGLLIRHWRSNWYDTYVSEVTTDLVASNIEDYDPVYFFRPASLLTIALFGGVVVEIFIIGYFVRKRFWNK